MTKLLDFISYFPPVTFHHELCDWLHVDLISVPLADNPAVGDGFSEERLALEAE